MQRFAYLCPLCVSLRLTIFDANFTFEVWAHFDATSRWMLQTYKDMVVWIEICEVWARNVHWDLVWS